MRLLGVRGALRDGNGRLVPIYSDEPPTQLPEQPVPPAPAQPAD